MNFDKVLDLLSQPSTWSGVGILGLLGVMAGIPITAVQQAGTVAIALIGAYNVIRNENKTPQ